MTIDYDFARRCYPYNIFYPISGADKFHPAYLKTNENLRKTVPAFKGNFKDVLTVAASGDQPLFYALNGAKNIDTFDQTYCAKAVMDLKTVAVQKFSYKQYCDLVQDLFNASGADVMEVSGVPELVAAMPAQSAEFIRQMSKSNIFSMGAIGRYDASKCLTEEEFNKVKQTGLQPFNFIWADITDLHTHLTKKYDIINVSNIFEWVEMKSYDPRWGAARIVSIMKSLYPYLKPNGYLMSVGLDTDTVVDECFDAAVKQIGGGVYNSYCPIGDELVMILRAPKKQR